MFSNGKQNIFSLVKNIEKQAIESGASKVEINGLVIINDKIINPEMAKRLGYTFKQLDKSTISLSKNLH